ncbi:FKBP-type peptidyl-prolyl cis-trans isomerase [uncultured Pseudoxanthomonas sp.]|uniref:FKBP-type peptidyl-prolyl cis-trans isomerase n=1 Tax=uncultured Pseudoxanthomonas sp. TaxID=281701 RepID=UPI0026370591|nr:FKBP-type peptidyl-prolyl cis-trans isomerase [uncultured Pseudoxanthomonas sp.]
MKRSVRGAAVLLAISFSMLGGSVSAQEKTALVTERDKVSYAIGVDVGNSLQPVGPFMDIAAFQRAIADTFAGKPKAMTEQEAQATDQLLRMNLAVADGQTIPGMPPGSTPPPVDKTKVGVFLGTYVIGPSLLPFKDEVDPAVLAQAVKAVATKSGTPLLTLEQAQAEMQAYLTKRQTGVAQRNRDEGAAFLAANKAKPGVVTTPSGLQYMVLRQGNGQRPQASSRVRVNYEGKLLNGDVFDSSYARGEPAEFGLGQVIAGWTEGVSLMPVGAKYRFWIPSNLAYGPNGAPGGKIGPDATLTFDVELMGVLQ